LFQFYFTFSPQRVLINRVSISDCGDPTPEHGQANILAGTRLDEMATITCDSGYILDGHSVIKCLETGWNATLACTLQGK
jgi:hypothetical protein